MNQKYNLPPEEVMKEIHEVAQKFFPDEEFNNHLKNEVGYIKDLFKEKRHGLEPQLIVLGNKDSKGERPKAMVVIIADDFNKNRYQYFFGAGIKLAEEGFRVSAVFLMTEAWMRQFGKDEEMKGNVSDYDDKKEVVVISGATLDLRFNGAMCDLKRDKEGVVTLGDPTYMLCDYKNVSASLHSDLLMEFLKGFVSVGMTDKMKKAAEDLKNKPRN